MGFVLMGRAMLSKSLIQFSVDEQGCVSSLLFPMTKLCIVGVMMVMATSFKRAYAKTVVFSAPDPAAGHCGPTPPPETPRHSQASLAQSLMGTLFLSLGSWCTQGFICALQESVSPALWKFCNQIPLASKVKLPRGSQSFCQIPRLGNLLWVLELSRTFLTVREYLWYNCSAVCGSSALGSIVGLMATSSKREDILGISELR